MKVKQVIIPKTDFIDFPPSRMLNIEKIEIINSDVKSSEKLSNVGNKQPNTNDGASFSSGYFEKRCIPEEKR